MTRSSSAQLVWLNSHKSVGKHQIAFRSFRSYIKAIDHIGNCVSYLNKIPSFDHHKTEFILYYKKKIHHCKAGPLSIRFVFMCFGIWKPQTIYSLCKYALRALNINNSTLQWIHSLPTQSFLHRVDSWWEHSPSLY